MSFSLTKLFHKEKKETSPKIIVSLTTYPDRIYTVRRSIDSIIAQTVKPDRIILWLAESQFPGRELELPDELTSLVNDHDLEIQWCEDLKSHKKYFFALQQFPNDIVITFDDDILYENTIIEDLLESYKKYPNAISAARVHFITLDESGIFPYDLWLKECDASLNKPTLQAIATTGAGTLYPPNILSGDVFNKEQILELCPTADDLWLKMHEIILDIPIVLARKNKPLILVPGSQETALVYVNIDQSANDHQMQQIINYIEKQYNKGILTDKILHSDNLLCCSSVREYCETVVPYLEIMRKQRKKTYIEKIKYDIYQDALLNDKKTLFELKKRQLLPAQLNNFVWSYIENATVSAERNGFQFRTEDDGSITVIGKNKSSKKTTFTFVSKERDNLFLEKGQYYLFGCPKGGSGETYRIWIGSEDKTVSCFDEGRGITFELNCRQKIGISIDIFPCEMPINLNFAPVLCKL